MLCVKKNFFVDNKKSIDLDGIIKKTLNNTQLDNYSLCVSGSANADLNIFSQRFNRHRRIIVIYK